MRIRIWFFNALLLAAVAVSSINTYRIWTRPMPWQSGGTGAGESEPAPKAIGVAFPRPQALSAFGEVVARNLFDPSRRPVEAPAETVVDEPPPEEVEEEQIEVPEETAVKINNRQVFLYGVILAGESRKALVSNPFQKGGERPGKWIVPGESLESFEVYRIEPRRVLLRKEGKLFQLSLDEKLKPRFAGPTAGAPSAERPTVVHAGTSVDTSRKPVGKDGAPSANPPPAAGMGMVTPFDAVGAPPPGKTPK